MLLALAVQSWRNADRDDFSGHDDEPAHYVMALTVHDYLSHPLPAWPVRFAQLYYLHYPKIAFGHWPPLFHILAGAWMLLAGTSREAVLVLLAIATGACSLALFAASGKHLSRTTAFAIAALLPLLPATQQLYSMVMLEIPCALASLVALIYLARFFAGKNERGILWFAFWASTAILTKPNAWALGLAPLFAMIILWDFRALREVKLWAAAGFVVLTCVPFYAIFFRAMSDGIFSVGYLDAFLFTCKRLPEIAGGPILLFAVVGAAVEVLAPLIQRRRIRPFWAVMLSGFVSAGLFFCIIPGGLERRHLFYLIPPVLLFSGRGLEAAAQALAERGLSMSTARFASAACLVLLFFSFSFRLQQSYCDSFAQLAAYAHQHLKGGVYLISSSGNGEGRFIAEFANSEPFRPEHIVLRGSKQLATNNWAGNRYVPKYLHAADVKTVLDQVPVSVLVLHNVAGQTPELHQELLQKLVAQDPQEWRLVYRKWGVDPGHGTEELAVYVNAAHIGKAISDIHVDLSEKLNLKYSSHALVTGQ
ncbi:MAG: glycosyltransferase family 39 protein [Candidatus Korobacteraceae bacterium]